MNPIYSVKNTSSAELMSLAQPPASTDQITEPRKKDLLKKSADSFTFHESNNKPSASILMAARQDNSNSSYTNYYKENHNAFLTSLSLGAIIFGLYCIQMMVGSKRNGHKTWRPSAPGISQVLLSMSIALTVLGLTGLAYSPRRKIGRGHGENDPSLFPRLDQHVAYMRTSAPDTVNFSSHFNTPVPRNIHQIWFGDQSKAENRKAVWSDYAANMGYGYKLWTEKDLVDLPLTADNQKIIELELARKDYCAASDIARLEILNAHGGVYLDVDFNPPKKAEKWVPFEDVFPMRHLTLMTEAFARDVGALTGMFVCNGFLAASKGHPFIAYARDTVAKNWEATNKSGLSSAMYSTGPFFLNAILRGSPQILPFPEAEKLGMITW